MAFATRVLSQKILDILLKNPDGLEVSEILKKISSNEIAPSERSVRNLLNKLVKEGQLIKRRGWKKTPGTPPYVYCHPHNQPLQLEIPGVTQYMVFTKAEIEDRELDQEELKRQQKACSVLHRIAEGHLHQEIYARAIIEIAPKLAKQNPIELLIKMAHWVVEDLNSLGSEIERKLKRGDREKARKLTTTLEARLGWTKRYFQQFWRFHRSIEDTHGILDLPQQAKHFFLSDQRAYLDESKARQHLQKRILGNQIIEDRIIPTNLHKSAAGTDASVADLYLERSPGSFIPPDPVVVTTAAAALITDTPNSIIGEYQDFDISPDNLKEYQDYDAAVKGLVLSPTLKSILDDRNLEHSRKAAMDLRQYYQDFRIATKDAKWRPIGNIPELGISNKPTLIIRDGRIFPLVHRLKDYEAGGLFGQIVHSEIEKFKQVFHYTALSSDLGIVYGAAVKSPGMSWLAPLVFWYIHVENLKIDNDIVINDPDEVYQYPFTDTAVSHLLFLGLAKKLNCFSNDRLFITCRVIRRFSDIALEDEAVAPVINENDQLRYIEENSQKDWKIFIEQHLEKKKKHYQENSLDVEDYNSFIYLCSKVGVSMFYTAPTSVYQPLATDMSTGHFLLPRLEVAINTELVESNKEHEQDNLDSMLSWLATGHIELDSNHTQSGFDTGNQEHHLPILVPNVVIRAHEAATFSRTKLGEEVQDELRSLIAELRKRFIKN